MKTFFNLLQTLINKKNKSYPDESFNNYCNEVYNPINSYIELIIYNTFYNEKKSKGNDIFFKSAHAKFLALNETFTNSFIKQELKEQIFHVFSLSQKHYFSFNRLARIYKIKKYPYIVTDDLTLNPLDINNKNTFFLIENKSKYLFSLNDLVSIIETAIGHAPNFFSEPLSPSNPYNNQQFSIATLYNIYFKLKESTRLMSSLFHFFFLENFNKTTFSEHYEPFLRENAIKKYTFNSPYTILHSSVLVMLSNNMYTRNYIIHKNFPKETLVDIFRPFLFYFFIANYDIKGTTKIFNYKQILNIKLKQFYNYNPAFGRQYIQTTIIQNNRIKKEYKFNTKHISFYTIPVNTRVIYTDNFYISTINILLNSNTHNVNNIYNNNDNSIVDSDDNDTDDNDTDDNDTNANANEDNDSYSDDFDSIIDDINESDSIS